MKIYPREIAHHSVPSDSAQRIPRGTSDFYHSRRRLSSESAKTAKRKKRVCAKIATTGIPRRPFASIDVPVNRGRGGSGEGEGEEPIANVRDRKEGPTSVSTYNNIPKHVNTLEWHGAMLQVLGKDDGRVGDRG